MGLEGKVIIVTGSTEGIGEAVVQSLSDKKSRLVLAARTEEKLDRQLKQVEKRACDAAAVPTDVTDPISVNRLVEKAVEYYGRIDILINNVGRGLRKPLIELTDDEWHDLVAVNLSSVVYCCRAVLPYMRKQKDGQIINIASRSGRVGEAEMVGYSAVKHGVVGLTKALAIEEAPNGVRVNAICPGPVATDRMEKMLPHIDKSGWLKPGDIADAVLFLIGLPGQSVQGQTIDLF